MKCCSKCGNDKLIEGIKYCLNCGAEVEKCCSDDVKCCGNEKVNKCVNHDVNEDGKYVVKTRMSVEVLEII